MFFRQLGTTIGMFKLAKSGAAAVALSRRFAVISGCTGKTTTVTKLPSAMVEQSLSQGKNANDKARGTNVKAAARLTESIVVKRLK